MFCVVNSHTSDFSCCTVCRVLCNSSIILCPLSFSLSFCCRVSTSWRYKQCIVRLKSVFVLVFLFQKTFKVQIYVHVFHLTSSVVTTFLLTLSASDNCLFIVLFSRSKFSILLSYLVFISKSLLSKLFLKWGKTNENEG